MLEKILVPVDGSEFSEHALPLAMGLARRAEATIHLVRVYVTRGLPYYEVLSGPDPAEGDRLREQAEDALRSMEDRLEAEGVSVHAELLDGTVTDALTDYIAAQEIDLVVMTTHGRGGLSRAWLGSVADRLVRRSAAPVLMVRPGETEPADVDGIDEILVPLDGSATAEGALPAATALAKLTGARLALLLVYLYGVPPVQARMVAMRREGEPEPTSDYLEGVANDLREQGLEAEAIVGTDYLPAPAILEHAKKRGSDLIVIATHGRGGWTRFALGSVADKVMRAATVPVLIARAGEEE